MKKIVWAVLLLVLLAESGNSILPVQAKDQAFFTGLIISWQEKKNTSDSLFLRVRETKTNTWTRWYKIDPDFDVNEKDGEKIMPQSEIQRPGWFIAETIFSTNLSDTFEYKIESGAPEPAIRHVTIKKILSNKPGQPVLLSSLNIPKKNPVISRASWGANEEITFEENPQGKASSTNGEIEGETDDQSTVLQDDPDIDYIISKDEATGRNYLWPLQYAKKIRFIVIHHTASVSNLDNPKTAIQNIEYYHAVKRGWGDIGYNYLIDPEGNIYEGRKGGEKVIGGHAKPLNKVSIGIAVLGNYEKNEVPSKVLRSLMGLIREKAKTYKIAVNGNTIYKEKIYNNVEGHDENTPTTCPGRYIKEKLDKFKKLITYQNLKEPKAQPQEYDFQDFERREIFALQPDSEREFTIRLKNTGKVFWNNKTFIENTSLNDMPKIIASLVSPRVKPGNLGVFKGKIPGKLVSGLRVVDAGLVINGSIRPQKTIHIPIMVQGLQGSYEIISRKDPPVAMKAGQRTQAWITLKNTGSFTWKRFGRNKISLGTASPRDHESVFVKGNNLIGRLVEKKVAPGETGKFVFNLKAPASDGTYTEYFQPLVEGVTWLPAANMSFTIAVQSKEKLLRVALSFDKEIARIRAKNAATLIAGKDVRRFTNEIISVSASAGGYQIATEEKSFAPFVALEPPRFTSDDGILELVNFENRPAWNTELNDNRFRGTLEVRSVSGKLTVINELPMEDYLKGIGEVSNGDPIEKIKTIIILARSYAKYYRGSDRKFPGKPYDLDDDPDHTQKYLGYGLEVRSPNIARAVTETTGQIVTYQGKPILTPYFNQSDGRTRSAEEVWGWKNAPYLQSVADTFCGTHEFKGHGVGLSGCGATELAIAGKTAEKIIKYYYQGVAITDGK